MNYYLIILGLLTIGGLATTIWGLKSLRNTQRIAAWPGTGGTIESSTAQSVEDDLLPEIVYRYEVEAVSYRNKLELPAGTLPSQELAKRLARDYPVGKTVEVRYDPDAHGKSVIEGAQRKGGDVFIILFGIAGTLFGILAMLQGI
ncbi:MAG: DUF3592 domain-containing protein [Gammaproteobacteria bacterium]|nr:DUF3592 domain-containing protein [Gammaproteobacteria bacterium]